MRKVPLMSSVSLLQAAGYREGKSLFTEERVPRKVQSEIPAVFLQREPFPVGREGAKRPCRQASLRVQGHQRETEER